MDVMKASVLVVVVGALQSHSAQAQSIVREYVLLFCLWQGS